VTVTTRPALKEWSAVVHALLDGRQTVLLRKGGIGERRFDAGPALDGPVLLFPTVAHSHAERVRPEHRDLLPAAARDSTEDEVTLRAGLRTVAAVAVERPENIEQIAGTHIWTAASVRADRVEFRPRHRLTALVVQAFPLAEPRRLRRTDEHRGCTSWVQVPDTVDWGPPVHDLDALTDLTERVRRSVG
jgi:hypothetical protein